MQITQRQFQLGAQRIRSQDADPGAAPYLLAGRRMYAIGLASGTPAPIGDEHLAGEMGGIWAHPLKCADIPLVTLQDLAGTALPAQQACFTDAAALVRWNWQVGAALAVQREDQIAAELPAYYLCLQLQAAQPFQGRLQLQVPLKFLGSWFSGLGLNTGEYRVADSLVLGQAQQQPGWGLVCGTAEPAQSIWLEPDGTQTIAYFNYTIDLAAGDERSLLFVLAVEHAGAVDAARACWQTAVENFATQRQLQQQCYLAAPDALTLACPQAPLLERDLQLARANLQLLATTNPMLGPYLLAGLPEYPQLFGCDTCYSITGALAAGLQPYARGSLDQLARIAQRACGRVPHEVTTNGRIFHPGNVLETPLLAIAMRDYLRWTADTSLLREHYATLLEGTLDLTLGGMHGWDYPPGDGIVERLGMGTYKLDSVCYAWAGLNALAELSELLEMPDSQRLRERADRLQAAFERDWWLPEQQLYADSLHSDGRPQLDGHWTAILPVQLGIAAPERASAVLQQIEQAFVNQWGLIHTRSRGRDERVWTLPTGLLALALLRRGRTATGLRLLRSIGVTAEHGTPGTLKELIPSGLCFVQLWSAGLLLQGVLEGLLGLAPEAMRHELSIAPQLPAEWNELQLNGLSVGQHRLDLQFSPDAILLDHRSGDAPLQLRWRTHSGSWSQQSIPCGQRIRLPY